MLLSLFPGGASVLQHTCRAQRTAYWSRFSPVTWVLGTELWPSLLAADTFTCWAITQPQPWISKTNPIAIVPCAGEEPDVEEVKHVTPHAVRLRCGRGGRI